jgi:hypothetical protein
MSMFQVSVPPSIAALTALRGIMAKGDAFCSDNKVDPSILLGSRLALTMFPLSRQVQIACDTVKNGCGRLAGVEAPSFPDTETTFAELDDRIDRTVTYLSTLSPSSIDGSEERPIMIKLRGREHNFLGRPYLLSFVLPNLYFHTSMAYAILRHNGVPLGKSDFLGSLPLVG